MTINEYARKLTLKEGLKKSVTVAQVKEILRLINVDLGGELYKALRKI